MKLFLYIDNCVKDLSDFVCKFGESYSLPLLCATGENAQKPVFYKKNRSLYVKFTDFFYITKGETFMYII